MFEFNVRFVFSVYLYSSIVFECESALSKYRCRQLRPINGQVRLLLVHGVTMAKITCFQPYVLVKGNEMMICVEGKWDSEFPVCAKFDSCHDNCGKISDGVGCSCDWSCHNNNNCCPDIQIKCPYIKPIDNISRLYLTTSTTTTPTTMTTSEKNKTLNVTIPKNRVNNKITIGKLTLDFNSRVLLHRTPFNSTGIGSILNPTLKGLVSRRSTNIVDHLNKNISTFSNKNLTDIIQPNSENSVMPLKHNQTLKTNSFSLNNYSGLPTVATESTNLLEDLTLNNIVGLSDMYNVIYIIGYFAAVGIILFIFKHCFFFMKSLIKKSADAKDQTFVETKNEGSRNNGLQSNLQE